MDDQEFEGEIQEGKARLLCRRRDLTEAQVESLLTDKDWQVRRDVIYREWPPIWYLKKRHLTEYQKERALTDECAEVRKAAIWHGNLTKAQRERALADGDVTVRLAIKINLGYYLSSTHE